MRVVALIFGIVSIVMGVTTAWLIIPGVISFILGALAIVFALVSGKKGNGSKGGLVCGIIGVVFSLFEIGISCLLLGGLSGLFDEAAFISLLF